MRKISEVMTREVETCSLLDNVYEAALKMRNWNVGSIPVVDGEKLVGVITDRDIVVRGIAEKKPPSSKVEEIMSEKLVTATPDISTEEAAKRMAQNQIRRLPIVDGERLLGIVSLGDLAIDEMTDEQAQFALSEISEPANQIQ